MLAHLTTHRFADKSNTRKYNDGGDGVWVGREGLSKSSFPELEPHTRGV